VVATKSEIDESRENSYDSEDIASQDLDSKNSGSANYEMIWTTM